VFVVSIVSTNTAKLAGKSMLPLEGKIARLLSLQSSLRDLLQSDCCLLVGRAIVDICLPVAVTASKFVLMKISMPCFSTISHLPEMFSHLRALAPTHRYCWTDFQNSSLR
jgi:hypothetical protein